MAYSYLFLCLFLVLTAISPGGARSFRPGQIPNGSMFSCANCHVNQNGGGARNLFGQTV